MKIEYVGVKADGETAFAALTGIERWMVGDTHEISDKALATRMLQHPDVFAEADAKPLGKPEAESNVPDAPDETLPPEFTIIKPDGTEVVLDTMEKDALKELATGLDVAFHPNSGAATLRMKLFEAFGEPEAE